MEKVFASVRFFSPISVAVARTSQSPFPLQETLLKKYAMESLKLIIFETSRENTTSYFPIYNLTTNQK